MEEFVQGLSRAELLKRGAAGAALLAGADALLRLEDAGASLAAPKPGGKLVVGIGQVFEDINVLTAFGYRWGQLMAYAMYDTLVKYDSKGRAVPLLATSSGASTASTIPSSPPRTTSWLCPRTSGAKPPRSTTASSGS